MLSIMNMNNLVHPCPESVLHCEFAEIKSLYLLEKLKGEKKPQQLKQTSLSAKRPRLVSGKTHPRNIPSSLGLYFCRCKLKFSAHSGSSRMLPRRNATHASLYLSLSGKGE